MDLIHLNLKTPVDVEQRSQDWAEQGLLTATEAGILSGQKIPGSYRPAVLSACTHKLTAVLAAGNFDPVLSGLLPWISRQIVECGEVVLLLDDRLRLRPVQEYQLQGAAGTRLYRALTVRGPTRTTTYRDVSPKQVCHAVVRPCAWQDWRGESWRFVSPIVTAQLAVVDQAIRQEGAAPRGTLLPTTSAESPERLRDMIAKLVKLAGGLSFHPLLGRIGEGGGPNPRPIRLQSSDLPALLKAREDLSAALVEALGFSRTTLGIGSGGQVSRPDSLRSWIATTATAWASILQLELERIFERGVRLDLRPCLSRLAPHNQRVIAVGRLVQQGISLEDAERLVGIDRKANGPD